MKIRTKLLLLLTFGVSIPLGLSQAFTLSITTHSMEQLVSENIASKAGDVAGRIDDRIVGMLDRMELVVESVPFERFDSGDLYRALEIPYKQLPEATVVALIDEGGKAVVPPFRPEPSQAEILERERPDEIDLESFSESIPLSLVLQTGAALGPVYKSSAGTPLMVGAMSFPIAGREERWVLAVGYSLAAVCELIGRESSGKATLYDALGRPVCAPNEKDASPTPQQVKELMEKLSSSPDGEIVQGAEGETFFSCSAKVPTAAWNLLLEEPLEKVMKPVESSVFRAVIWLGISLVLALAGGIVLARGISSPISQLEAATRKVAQGDYDAGLEVSSRDEVGELARTFNTMAKEIKAWNTELNRRVDEKTDALKQAQEQIIRTQKLAAVGEMGAGVAHEINNPLTTMLGNVQLLQMSKDLDPETTKALDDIFENGRRVADIVKVLLRLSQEQRSDAGQHIDLTAVMDDTVDAFKGRAEDKGVSLEKNHKRGCTILGNAGDLHLIFHHLIENAVVATEKGGRIRTSISVVDGGAVEVEIEDSGAGMSPQQLARAFDPFFTTGMPGDSSRGLGLPTVHRLVEEHGGKIIMKSEEGEGTRVTLYLPGAVELSKA